MVRRTGGSRRGTRNLMTKPKSQKGKISITRFMQEFNTGDVVVFKQEPSVNSGKYHKRLHGKIGKIIGKKGKCYDVRVSDRGVLKTIIVHPVHLKKQ
jgi:large subunit ribosomal protein L21e